MPKPSAILIVFLVSTVVSANPFVVNTTGDESDVTPGDDVCATADGGCTLRAAIQETNAINDGGFGTINFSITGTGPFTISPASALPSLTQIVDVNGYSQPGSATATSSTPANLEIVLDGTNAGNAHGLELTGDFAGASSIKGLVIQNFGMDGIHVTTSDNVIAGNYIGTSVDGGTAAGNVFSGVEIEGGSRNVVGGDNVAARNVISGNLYFGVTIAGEGGDQNQLYGNYIGTDALGTHRVNNLSGGVMVSGSSANTRIGADTSTTPELRNIISGNSFVGIVVSTRGTGTEIQGNYVGLDPTGELAVPNDDGIELVSTTNVVVGGLTAGERNVISGNTNNGIFLNQASANFIQGNFVGFNAAGTATVGNGNDGVSLVNSPENFIGGDTSDFPDVRNFIGGNGDDGIQIAGLDTVGTAVEGNYIGVSVDGGTAAGNAGNGILLLETQSNEIGGSAVGLRNLISGNSAAGITIRDGSFFNVVQGNYIGTNATGDGGIPNLTNGLQIIDSNFTEVGGPSSALGNVISGNTGSGVVIQRINDASSNSVRGNFIGTQADGVTALGNSIAGVTINDGTNNFVGGVNADDGNVIAFNGVSGVRVTSAGTANRILSNSIFSNGNPLATGALGIDLNADGTVNPNDAKDRDTGANNLQNFPILSAALSGSTLVSGTLNSTPRSNFRIQFFASNTCDASGNGEGKTFLGSLLTSTNTQGNTSFSFNTATNTSGVITATATNEDTGDTSEFSNCAALNSGGAVHDVAITAFRVPSGTADTIKFITLKVKNLGDHAESSVPFTVTGPGVQGGCTANAASFSPDGDLDPGEVVSVTSCPVLLQPGTNTYTATVQHGPDNTTNGFDANPANNTRTTTATGR